MCLAIIDEGSGLPRADPEAIFEKFHRAERGDHARPGTGLGLPIARGLIEAMGGRITATNRTDRTGAVFTLWVPEAAGPHEPDGTP